MLASSVLIWLAASHASRAATQSGLETVPGGCAVDVVPQTFPSNETLQALAACHEVPVTLHREVRNWLRYYTHSGRRDMRIYLERSARYRSMMRHHLQEAGVPPELVAIAIAESGLQPYARSPKGAVGPWQFVRATAGSYDIAPDYWTDPRRDPELSTIAAAEHLAELHDALDNWHLVMAAYNAGQGRLGQAMRRSGSRNYWRLRRYLPEETRNYVPRVLALMLISEHPTAFGFDEMSHDALTYETVEVPPQTPLASIAKGARVPERDLRQLNPALRRGQTPPGGPWRLRIPPDAREDVELVLIVLAAQQERPTLSAR